MNLSKHGRSRDAHNCSHPGRFVSGMAVAQAAFMLIWVPWKWLTIVCSAISVCGVLFMSIEVWHHAARRWRILTNRTSEEVMQRSVDL